MEEYSTFQILLQRHVQDQSVGLYLEACATFKPVSSLDPIIAGGCASTVSITKTLKRKSRFMARIRIYVAYVGLSQAMVRIATRLS